MKPLVFIQIRFRDFYIKIISASMKSALLNLRKVKRSYSLHYKKTDKLDPVAISKVYYEQDKELKEWKKSENIYAWLKDKNRTEISPCSQCGNRPTYCTIRKHIRKSYIHIQKRKQISKMFIIYGCNMFFAR